MQSLPIPNRSKSVYRAELLRSRVEHAEKHGLHHASQISQNVMRLLRDYPGYAVAAYRPMRGEAQFKLDDGIECYLPVVEGQEMRFYKATGPLLRHALGFEQPDPKTSEPMGPSQKVVVLAPAIAVDHGGQRLGWGKGFYDRFFALHPGFIRVAVIFQMQVSKDPLPAESWDQQLDWIVTENMVLRTFNKRSF